MSRNNVAACLAAMIFLYVPSDAVSKTAAPTADALLATVLNNPTQAYEGQMMVSYWSGNDSRAEDVRIFFSPPNNYRFEFLAPNGAVDRIVKSNGTNEQVQWMGDNQSYATSNPPRLLSPMDENKLLLENYKASLKNSENVIDRPTWAVELTPVVAGKPYQVMKIDQQTRVILEIKRYSPDGKTGSLTRFTKFSPGAKLSNNLFLSGPSFDAKSDYQQTDEPAPPASDTAFLLPTKLHGGFSMEARRNFEVNGKTIKHVRYTDGLLPVSIFETPLPVKAPQEKQQIIQWNRPLEMGTASAGNVYQWKKDEAYFILIGDLQQDLLRQIAGDIK